MCVCVLLLLQIPLHSLARANVFDKKSGDVLYSGLCWLDESVRAGSRFRRVMGFASRLTGLNKYFKFKQSMTLVWAHVHALPCSITLLAGLLPEAGWSSFCSSPFVQTWGGRPYVAGLGIYHTAAAAVAAAAVAAAAAAAAAAGGRAVICSSAAADAEASDLLHCSSGCRNQ